MKCLYKFENANEFLLFSKYFTESNWQIEKQLLKERANKYKSRYFFIDLKNRFLSKELTIWDLKDEEIITWIDTIIIMNRVLIKLEKRGINIDNVTVIMEYVVPFGNHMRADFLILFQKTIIVIEFGMFNQDERRSEERYSKKLHETIAYRQVLSNQLPPDIDVLNYVLVYKPEYDDVMKSDISNNQCYNNKEINTMVNFLEQIYTKKVLKNGYYYLKLLP